MYPYAALLQNPNSFIPASKLIDIGVILFYKRKEEKKTQSMETPAQTENRGKQLSS